MRVVFHLNPGQMTCLVQAVERQLEIENEYLLQGYKDSLIEIQPADFDRDTEQVFHQPCKDVYRWNMAPSHCCGNPAQEWILRVDKAELEYVGQRHPLHQDGSLAFVLRAVWPFAVSDHITYPRMKVLRYETSDKRLKWWETLDSYLNTRASLAEQCEAMKAKEDVHWTWGHTPREYWRTTPAVINEFTRQYQYTVFMRERESSHQWHPRPEGKIIIVPSSRAHASLNEQEMNDFRLLASIFQ